MSNIIVFNIGDVISVSMRSTDTNTKFGIVDSYNRNPMRILYTNIYMSQRAWQIDEVDAVKRDKY